jgi:hypothetical protein
MKRIHLFLLCCVSLVAFVACGEKKAKVVTGDEQVDQKLEQVEKKLSEMTGIEKCEATLVKRYDGKVKLADIQPDFDFEEVVEGFNCFEGNGVNNAKAVYQKKDGSQITPDEWKAYVAKIYGVTQKLAQDGKAVRGFGSNIDVKTREQALEEMTLQQLLDGGDNIEWGYLLNDRFEACYMSLFNSEKKSHVSVSFAEGLQKNLDEALKDAEKYMN